MSDISECTTKDIFFYFSMWHYLYLTCRDLVAGGVENRIEREKEGNSLLSEKD